MTLLISLLCIIASLLVFKKESLVKNKILRYFFAVFILIIGLGEISEKVGKAFKSQVMISESKK
jgi:Na+/phosphate symporter